MAYSVDFRRKALAIKEKDNLTQQQTADRFGVGIASVTRWTKNVNPVERRKKTPHKISDEAISKDVEQYPDSFQRERAVRLGCSKSGVMWALKRLNITYKKNAKSSKNKS